MRYQQKNQDNQQEYSLGMVQSHHQRAMQDREGLGVTMEPSDHAQCVNIQLEKLRKKCIDTEYTISNEHMTLKMWHFYVLCNTFTKKLAKYKIFRMKKLVTVKVFWVKLY